MGDGLERHVWVGTFSSVIVLPALLCPIGCAVVDEPAEQPSEVLAIVYPASYAHDLNNVPPEIAFGADPESLIPPAQTQTTDEESKVLFTYRFDCPSFLGCASARAEVDEALRAWERAPGLVFCCTGECAEEPPDVCSGLGDDREAVIRIRFESSRHTASCDTGFSSPATVLAHAYTVGCNTGEIHLNADLQWSLVGTRSTGSNQLRYDLRSVVIHEVGHLLGLGHAGSEASVMHASYSGAKRRPGDNEVRAVAEALAESAQ